jgi:hypothetical protein
MGVVLMGRGRLKSSVFAVAALASFASWGGQSAEAQESGIVACGDAAASRLIGEARLPNFSRVQYVSQMTPVIELARQTGARADADVAALTSARNACRDSHLSGRRHNVEAYSCVADMQLKIAQKSGSEAEYNDAYCAAQWSSALQSRARNAEAVAAAAQNSGDILMALRTINNPDSTRGSDLLNAAIREYQAAVRQPTAARHFALGGAYRARGNSADAATQMSLGARRDPANAAEAQSAIHALVNIAGDDPSAASAIPMLERARQLDEAYRGAQAPSMTVNAALGLRYAEAGNPNAANRIAEAIAGRDDVADYPGRNYLAEAHYYQASQDVAARNWSRALQRGQAALRAGGGTDPKFARLVCLAYIARGWTPETADSTACAVSTTTPQGQLLNMMFHLRRAQYINVLNSAGRPLIMMQSNARVAHQQEMIAVIQAYEQASIAIANWTPEQRQQALNDWPGASSIAPADRDIGEMLQFGRWVAANECPGGPRLPAYSSDGPGTIRGRGRTFYGLYRVDTCRAN